MAEETTMLPEECPLGLGFDGLSLNGTKRTIHDLQNATHDFAFAFDIDGVLMRGKTPLSGAKQTLEILQANAIPFILLTNGGGLTEADHAKRVGERLTMSIDEDQFVQSHTPFKLVVEKFQNEWIVVLGGQKTTAKELAAAYGFNPDKVISSSDIAKHHPSIHPFPVSSANESRVARKPTDNSRPRK